METDNSPKRELRNKFEIKKTSASCRLKFSGFLNFILNLIQDLILNFAFSL
jgi:hypothetical protein